MGQTAEELLGSLTDEQIKAYTVDPTVEGHIVVGADRFITVPDELKRIAVQHDHNIETVTFDCPRYWDEHDMSKMRIYINYMLSDNHTLGSYIVDNPVVDENDDTIMHFNWTISREVTQLEGTVTFLVCINKTDSAGIEVNHWNSELCNTMTVSKGLECREYIVSEYPDIITDLLSRMEALEGAVNGELITDILKDLSLIHSIDDEQNNRLISIEEALDIIDRNVTQNAADITSLRNTTSSNAQNISNLQAIIDSLEADGVVSNVSFNELERRVLANEQNIATLQTKTTNLEAAIVEIDSHLTSIISTEGF